MLLLNGRPCTAATPAEMSFTGEMRLSLDPLRFVFESICKNSKPLVDSPPTPGLASIAPPYRRPNSSELSPNRRAQLLFSRLKMFDEIELSPFWKYWTAARASGELLDLRVGPVGPMMEVVVKLARVRW